MRELKWHEFIQEQLTEHWIAHIREEIVSTVIANVLQKYRLEKKLFEFNSQCAHTAWLRLFNWIFSKIDCYSKRDTTGKILYLIVDIEPQPPSIESSIFENVPQILIQKSSFPQAITFPLPSTTAMKPTLIGYTKQITQQQQQRRQEQHQQQQQQQQQHTKSNHIDIEKLQNRKNKFYELKKLDEVADEMKRTSFCSSYYSKRNSYSFCMYEQYTTDLLRKNKDDQLNSCKEENKSDFFANISKPNKNNSSNTKQKDITNIRRSIKNVKRNEAKVLILQNESRIQFRRPSDRVEILYTILPERSEHLD